MLFLRQLSTSHFAVPTARLYGWLPLSTPDGGFVASLSTPINPRWGLRCITFYPYQPTMGASLHHFLSLSTHDGGFVASLSIPLNPRWGFVPSVFRFPAHGTFWSSPWDIGKSGPFSDVPAPGAFWSMGWDFLPHPLGHLLSRYYACCVLILVDSFVCYS